MSLSQSALLEVLDALNAGDGVDVIRSAVQVMMRELIEAEATAVIGAERHERTDARTAQLDGHRPRTPSTTAGDLELAIPKLRSGSSFPCLLERRRRIDQALFAVVTEAYLTGTTVRKADDLVKALGADTGISKSEVSRICADLDAEVAAFWAAFLRPLKARGLHSTQLVIFDAHVGLKSAIAAVMVGCAWQRCRVRFLRNVLAQVPKVEARLRDAADDITAFADFPVAHWKKT